MKAIIFSKNQIETLKKHSEQNSPNEACAILFGNNVNYQVTIKEIFLTKNIDQAPANFTISNEELIAAYSSAEKMALDVSGIFHSHPVSVPYPSLTDKKYMEINPVPWVIFSNINDEFKAYIYNSGIIIEIPVKVL
ncbi:MAG: M67 family metallopeptidase [Thaumarchaeota archaeon]|nr:M67 family metallopeptidase [Nitrososphaerota archaeon]